MRIIGVVHIVILRGSPIYTFWRAPQHYRDSASFRRGGGIKMHRTTYYYYVKPNKVKTKSKT